MQPELNQFQSNQELWNQPRQCPVPDSSDGSKKNLKSSTLNSKLYGFAVVYLTSITCLFLIGRECKAFDEGKCDTFVFFDGDVKDSLPIDIQARVKTSIEGGIAYLRRSQNVNGSFGNGIPINTARYSYPVGYTALPGLALLECGISSKDPAIRQAAMFVRKLAPSQKKTYEISLAILFLDRLGDADDRPLIQSLALRLAVGQGPLGGWGYTCPLLTPVQEKKLFEILKQKELNETPKLWSGMEKPKAKKSGRFDDADNSNTQFAILALWSARRHELPLGFTLGLAEQRFRASQNPSGWGYLFGSGGGYGSMTGAGLLGLAVGRGCAFAKRDPLGKNDEAGVANDPGIHWGLQAFAIHMANPNNPAEGALPSKPKGALNFYFLWTVERVGVLCNLKTIGGKEWYRWGVELLLPTQNRDGSWTGRGNGGSAPVIDTSMALLFLKRSDLLPDLREALQKRITIVDPGIDGKGVPPTKKSPGEKSGSPGEKGAWLHAPGDGSRGRTAAYSPAATRTRGGMEESISSPSHIGDRLTIHASSRSAHTTS